MSAQYKKLYFRVYMAEELPKMDEISDDMSEALKLKRLAG